MTSSTQSKSHSRSAVILAAGKGTRMKSDLPKVMHPACGAPMVQWVVDAARAVHCSPIVLVVGHGAHLVRAHFEGQSDIEFVMQSPQFGTGHAVDQARPVFARGRMGDETLVLCGDGPLIRPGTLETLLDTHRESQASATLATAMLDDATGYGRIERDANGQFLRIVEQKDATPAQLAIREVNPSYYCFRTEHLFDALTRVTNQNASGEYYITDVFELLLRSGRRVSVVDAVPPEDVLSVNTPEQLDEVDRVLRARTPGAATAGGRA
ncbi:MAG: NTP transferase domain-containing protein [Phycisphaerae bacterium]|nr:NTP transferase domain-containing protein [Phycisphaerae bacterium]